MKRFAVLIVLSVSLSACGRDSGEDPGPEPGPPPATPPTETRRKAEYGFAREDEKTLRAAWAVAFFDEESRKLKIGFLGSEPGEAARKTIYDARDLFMGTNLEDPLVQVTFGFDDDAPPSGDTVNHYAFLFQNFGDMTMTLNRSGSMTKYVELAGDIRKGGTVRGWFKGSDKFDFEDEHHVYTWDLSFDLPIR